MPVVTSASAARTLPSEPEAHQTDGSLKAYRPRRWPLAVAAVTLALLVGLSAGQLIQRATTSPPPISQSAATSSARPSTVPQPYRGATVPLAATSVTATCTAPDGQDAQGEPVSYGPGNVVDGSPTSAWRCNGDGVGQRLIFTFKRGQTIVGVGLVNGYTKADRPTSSLYDQYRRISSVRWDLPSGAWFIQNLSEGDVGMQRLMIPPVSVDGVVRLTILTSSEPGLREERTRDAVLISEVEFLTIG